MPRIGFIVILLTLGACRFDEPKSSPDEEMYAKTGVENVINKSDGLESIAITNVLVGDDGEVYFMSGRNLHYFKPGTTADVEKKELPAGPDRYAEFLVTKDGTIYVARGDQYLYRSRDRGSTFEIILDATAYGKKLVEEAFVDSKGVLYVASDNDILISTDDGKTFIQALQNTFARSTIWSHFFEYPLGTVSVCYIRIPQGITPNRPEDIDKILGGVDDLKQPLAGIATTVDTGAHFSLQDGFWGYRVSFDQGCSVHRSADGLYRIVDSGVLFLRDGQETPELISGYRSIDRISSAENGTLFGLDLDSKEAFVLRGHGSEWAPIRSHDEYANFRAPYGVMRGGKMYIGTEEDGLLVIPLDKYAWPQGLR